jgi:hypothetical protein
LTWHMQWLCCQAGACVRELREAIATGGCGRHAASLACESALRLHAVLGWKEQSHENIDGWLHESIAGWLQLAQPECFTPTLPLCISPTFGKRKHTATPTSAPACLPFHAGLSQQYRTAIGPSAVALWLASSLRAGVNLRTLGVLHVEGRMVLGDDVEVR